MAIAHEFEYVKPRSLDDAVELLAKYGPKAQVLAGGTDLIGWIRDELIQPEALIDILFQLRFIGQEGFRPILEHCSCCQTDIDMIDQEQFCFYLKQGGIVCGLCPVGGQQVVHLSKGTLKQLRWLMNNELSVAERIRFSPQGIVQATTFLQAFVPYHIGRMPKSLSFLQQVCSNK